MGDILFSEIQNITGDLVLDRFLRIYNHVSKVTKVYIVYQYPYWHIAISVYIMIDAGVREFILMIDYT